ncbi:MULTISPECIES: Maff2 family mobile element protein [Lachnospiraceae]
MLIFSRLISSQYFLIKDIKQLMAGAGIMLLGTTLIPQLATLFS